MFGHFKGNAVLVSTDYREISGLGKIWEPEIEAIKTLVGWFEKLAGWITKVSDKLTGGGFSEWMGRTTAKVLASLGNKEALAALEANGDIAPGGQQPKPAASGGATAGDAKTRAMAFFRSMGWGREQTAGIVANLLHESGLNPNATGDSGRAFGIAQWHPDRQANFKKWAGKDIRDSTLQDQLGFVQYELTLGAEKRVGAMLLAARNAEVAGSIMSRYYERPLAADSEAAKRGATAVQLSTHTVIHVNGSTDPAGTAQQVAQLQNRVAQDQVRNLRPVMQ